MDPYHYRNTSLLILGEIRSSSYEQYQRQYIIHVAGIRFGKTMEVRFLNGYVASLGQEMYGWSVHKIWKCLDLLKNWTR